MSKKLEIIAEPGKTSFTTRRTVDAPRALVFEAITKCEHLKRWMGPCNVTMVSCSTDLSVGGRYRFVFRGPDGNKAGFSGEFRRSPPGTDRPDVRVRTDPGSRRARNARAEEATGRRSSRQRRCTRRWRTATDTWERHGSRHDRRLASLDQLLAELATELQKR